MWKRIYFIVDIVWRKRMAVAKWLNFTITLLCFSVYRCRVTSTHRNTFILFQMFVFVSSVIKTPSPVACQSIEQHIFINYMKAETRRVRVSKTHNIYFKITYIFFCMAIDSILNYLSRPIHWIYDGDYIWGLIRTFFLSHEHNRKINMVHFLSLFYLLI